jgi:hypothetical protein
MYYGHKWVFTIQGTTIDEATEEALHFAYYFLGRALQEHRNQGRNGEYETFAVTLLALLQKYRHLYTNPPEAPAPD